MIKQKVLIAGFFYGLIFESLGAEAPGFYLLPAMVAAFLYFKFLFMLKAVNAVLAFVSGLFLMIFFIKIYFAYFHVRFFTFNFALHLQLCGEKITKR